ncbi:MAG: phage tail sheath family protein [Acidobacteriia bacterium]|nr:phage tail sheath family protein [Terriglobia bacterium]
MPEYLSPGVYVEEIVAALKPIEGVSTSTVGFVGRTEHIKNSDFDNDTLLDTPTLITSWAEFVGSFGRYDKEQAPYLPPAMKGFFENGGTRCFVVRVRQGATDGEYVGTDEPDGKKTGLRAFMEIDEVKILCVPGVTSSAVQQAMIAHCESMRYRFCILDSQENANVDVVAAQRGALSSEKGFGALYFPWIKVSIEVTVNGQTQLIQDFVPPSGHIAGIYARTDREKGVHKAPANALVQGALETRVPVTRGGQEFLNNQGINTLRSFPGRGIHVWGARTFSTDPEWKYVNIRRLAIFIEESIDRGTQWVVFEPDDENTWARVRAAVTDFLTQLWRDGALFGVKAEEAFLVRCDRTTISQDDIDNGRVIILIGIAAIKPAEFIILRIEQQTVK